MKKYVLKIYEYTKSVLYKLKNDSNPALKVSEITTSKGLISVGNLEYFEPYKKINLYIDVFKDNKKAANFTLIESYTVSKGTGNVIATGLIEKSTITKYLKLEYTPTKTIPTQLEIIVTSGDISISKYKVLLVRNTSIINDQKTIIYDEIVLLWKEVLEELKELEMIFDEGKINKQFYRRFFLKNIFSAIEAYLHIVREFMKINLTIKPSTNNLDYKQLYILNGKNITLQPDGKIKEIDTFHNFESMLRFTFNTCSKFYNIQNPDYDNIDFSNLKKMSKRRNDITHPKSYEKFLIKDDEVFQFMNAFSWFMNYSNGITNAINVFIKNNN